MTGSKADDQLLNIVEGMNDSNNFQGVIKECTKGIELYPDDSRLYFWRANAKGETEDLQGALNDYTKAIELEDNPKFLIVFYQNSAVAKSQLGDNQGSINDYEKAIELDPNNESLYLFSSEAKQRLDDKEGCIEDLNKALEINPKCKEAYRRLGILNVDEDDPEAIKAFNNYIDIDPSNPEIYYLRGICNFIIEKEFYALMDFNICINILLEQNIVTYYTADAFFKRGRVKYHLNDNEGSLKDINIAIKLEPENEEIINFKEETDFSFCYKFIQTERYRQILAPFPVLKEKLLPAAQLGYKKAINSLKEGYVKMDSLLDKVNKKIEQEKKSAGNYIIRAFLKERFDPLDAIKDYTSALEINPKLSNILIYRGLIREDTGDILGAVKDYREAIEIDPEETEFDPEHTDKNLVIESLNKKEDYENSYDVPLCPYEEAAPARELLGKLLKDRNEIVLNNFEDYYCRALSRYSSGHYLGSLEDFNKAIEIQGNRANLYVNRGNCKDILGDSKSALEDYSKAIDIDPEHTDAFYNRGVARRDSGDEVGALSDFEKTIELNPNFYNAHQNIGSIKFRGSDLKGACYAWKKSSELGNTDVDRLIDRECSSLGILASASFYKKRAEYKYEYDNDYEGAKDDYLKSIEVEPRDATTYFDLGNTYIDLSDEANAISCFTKAIEINPNDSISYFNRGVAEMNSYAFDEALLDFKKVIEIDPEYARAYASIGEILIDEVGEFKESIDDAIIYLDKSIELNEDNAEAYYYRSLGKRELKDFKGALSDALRAYEINPEYRDEMESMIASDYYQLGQYGEAIQFIKKEIAKYDGSINKDLYIELSRYKKASGDIDGAKSDLLIALNEVDKEISKSEEFNEYRIRSRAEINELLGDFKWAICDYNQLIELGRPVVKGWYLLKSGECKKELGDLKGACEDWKKAADLGDEDAAKLLKEHC